MCFSALSIAQSSIGQPLTFYGTGNDRSIREVVRTDVAANKFSEKRYEEGVQYSQVIAGHQRRVIFAGVCEQNKPGSI